MNITILSSHGQCGIYEYSQSLAEAFRAEGHQVEYLGVRHHDDRGLLRAARQVGDASELVLIEYEPGIFRLRPLVAAMAYLRWVRRKKVMLSVHEIEPGKFPDTHHLLARLNQPVRFGGLGEIARIGWSTVEVAIRFAHLRLFLFGLGALPHHLVVHSPKAQEGVGIAANPAWPKLFSVPLIIKPMTDDPVALRRELGLPEERFYFIVPGFLFRRKRIVEVIRQLPEGSGLLVVGTPSQWDPGYVEEIEAAMRARPAAEIHLIQDYERMEQYLQAADAAVLYYEDGYQSAIATQAIGAGKPCVFSDLPAFEDYREAALYASSPAELHRAMVEIQEPATYERLRQGALAVRERFSPPRIAAAHLAPLRAQGQP